MGKKIAIIQSNYIPWKGYFNIIKCVDEFILLDDVQYTRRDWRNRNIIKTQSGLKWLSVPVEVKGQYLIDIKDVRTAGIAWRADHLNQIAQAYKKARYYSWFMPVLEDLYLNQSETSLSRINYSFIQRMSALLNITTPVRLSMEFSAPSGKTERLVHICKAVGADEYISGAAAKDYLIESLFVENNIAVKWADYSDYSEYRQLHGGPFEHFVSVIDLLFNEGPEAHHFLKDKIWN